MEEQKHEPDEIDAKISNKMSFIFKCKLCENIVEDCPKHVNECDFTVIDCKYCSLKVIRKELKNHLESTHTCEWCETIGVENGHKCGDFPYKCKFCKRLMKNCDRAQHELSCAENPNLSIKCFKCNAHYIRGELKSHVKDNCTTTLTKCLYCDEMHQFGEHVSDCKKAIKCPTCDWYGNETGYEVHKLKSKKFEVGSRIHLKSGGKYLMYIIDAITDTFIRTHSRNYENNAIYQINLKDHADLIGCVLD